MPRDFSESTRVQIPAMVHLTRLGYQYFGKIHEEQAGTVYDAETNILLEVFQEQFERLNPTHEGEYAEVLRDIKKKLNDDDLGRGFYDRLKSTSPTRLIDYDHPENNVFHFTAEFTCKNGDDEFRPDITLFINGLPLCFVEVKKPNNPGGMVAESNRMNDERFPNKKFRRFINITQLMIFSNNMEYDTLGGIVPIQGAFYCTGARSSASFNCFREENPHSKDIAPYHKKYLYQKIDSEIEKKILSDYNCQVIHNHPEYKTNLDENTPTNRILTSMCSPERLLFIIKYGIAYVKMEREVDGKIESIDEKHIMRYQQLFAALAVRKKLSEGVKSGIIWHTQGSGKTALAYYLTHILTDFYAKQNTVAKFYFIVDRLHLLEQAFQEFKARGLEVSTADNRKELMEQFCTNQAQEGVGGQAEITVVNIQRFAEDDTKVDLQNDYAINLQRVFILDEAHRGYRPDGCFLANLFGADPNSIKIALTGTPLLGEERNSRAVFGNYLHAYYYDKSIQDGYTLKIMREDIETVCRQELNRIYDVIHNEIHGVDALAEENDVARIDIIEHENYVSELLRYIIRDLVQFRIVQGDDTLGGMIICETSEQARKLYGLFDRIREEVYPQNPLKAGLILHDYEDVETRKQFVTDFKKNMTIDILIVYNMLLTGFDAPRLKRLYLGRKLKKHTLLQAITRVNRPYKQMHYGFLIDFADIKQDFEKTNEAYLQELNEFNNPALIEGDVISGTGAKTFINVIEDKDEIMYQMENIRQTLFDYSIENAEDFSKMISDEKDKDKLFKLRKALVSARDMANMVRILGNEDIKKCFEAVKIEKLPSLLSEVQHRIAMINLQEAFTVSDQTKMIINDAMSNIEFKFSLRRQEELNLISGENLKEKWQRTIHAFTQNIDQDDPEFITLREAFFKRFKEHGFVIDSKARFDEEIKFLDNMIKKLKDIQNRNSNLLNKYNGDVKFVRVHKRIREANKTRKGNPIISSNDETIMRILKAIKADVDTEIDKRNDILNRDDYFNEMVLRFIYNHLHDLQQCTLNDYKFIQKLISEQYLNQYRSIYATA